MFIEKNIEFELLYPNVCLGYFFTPSNYGLLPHTDMDQWNLFSVAVPAVGLPLFPIVSETPDWETRTCNVHRSQPLLQDILKCTDRACTRTGTSMLSSTFVSFLMLIKHQHSDVAESGTYASGPFFCKWTPNETGKQPTLFIIVCIS
jgi:hypothetical protein